jgi:soluble lytic murein transglycosylase
MAQAARQTVTDMRNQMFKIWMSTLLLAMAAPAAMAASLNADQASWYAARLAAHDRKIFAPTPEQAATAPRPDALAERLVQWDKLRRDTYRASFAELSRFLSENPGWPSERDMRITAEQTIMTSVDGVSSVTAFFNRFPPITATGKLRRAESLSLSGQRDAAVSLVRDAWISGGLSANDEQSALAQYGTALLPADHYARANQLLWNGQTTAAGRLLGYLPTELRPLIEARIALRNRDANAMSKVEQVGTAQRNNAGLVYNQALWLRSVGNSEDAAVQLILNTKVNSKDVLEPKAWATLLQSMSRGARDAGNIETAYRLLAEHNMADNAADFADEGEAERVAYVETEWTAGWIALRYLRRPADAVKHFSAMQPVAQSPITLARSAYWTGRAAEAMNNGALAQQWYARAAQFPDVFYGQLSIDKLGRSVPALDMKPPAIDPDAMRTFMASDVVRAATMLGEIGEVDKQSSFISALARRANTPEEKRVAADLAHNIQRLDLGVRIGKLARTKGIWLSYASYPRITLPEPGNAIWSLVHAITRQESLFNQRAISRAGARGMMQLMPATANGVAKKIGLDYTPSRLLSDPVYNMTLGSTYLQSRLDLFGGNHVLAVASYNAGAGNVSKWIAAYGDPRDPTVDVIDWIEQIPFKETRDYVMRVLENAVVYKTMEPGRKEPNNYNLLTQYLGRTPGRV